MVTNRYRCESCDAGLHKTIWLLHLLVCTNIEVRSLGYLAYCLAMSDSPSSIRQSSHSDSLVERARVDNIGRLATSAKPLGLESNLSAILRLLKLLKTLKTRDLGKDASGLCKAMSLVKNTSFEPSWTNLTKSAQDCSKALYIFSFIITHFWLINRCIHTTTVSLL